MNIEPRSPSTLSDAELLVELSRLAAAERGATVRLIIALAEVEARRLYLGEGCSSLFVYCTRVLRLSEHAAYGRIEAVRASQRFPVLLEMLVRGDVTMTTVCLLGPHLTPENCDEVLARARHKSKREVEEIIASLRPRPDAPTTLRKLPEHRPKRAQNIFESGAVTPPAERSIAKEELKPAAPAIVRPLAPERYKLQITIGRETQMKLRRAQDLLRHAIPVGDLAVVLDRALDLLLADLERKKFAASGQHRSAGEVQGRSCDSRSPRS
jgi:hypothetical protein